MAREILLVEDDNVNQIVISHMLQGRGHNVDIANNGLEALAACERRLYDVILMDIQLPEMDGIEATKRIRDKEGLDRHTPIIALTAFALQGDKEKFLGLGMDGYISKPVRIEELFLTIDKVCENGQNEPNFSERPRLSDNGELVFIQEIGLRSEDELRLIINGVTENIKELSEAIADGNMLTIEVVAHSIKELFSEADAEELKSVAFKIELASRRGNLKKIIECAMQLNYEFETYRKSVNL